MNKGDVFVCPLAIACIFFCAPHRRSGLVIHLSFTQVAVRFVIQTQEYMVVHILPSFIEIGCNFGITVQFFPQDIVSGKIRIRQHGNVGIAHPRRDIGDFVSVNIVNVFVISVRNHGSVIYTGGVKRFGIGKQLRYGIAFVCITEREAVVQRFQPAFLYIPCSVTVQTQSFFLSSG